LILLTVKFIIPENNRVFEKLVGGVNPLKKYARQIGSFPQIGVDIKKYLSCHHLETV